VLAGIVALAIGATYFLIRPTPPSSPATTSAAAKADAKVSAPSSTTSDVAVNATQPHREYPVEKTAAPLPPPNTPLRGIYAELAARAHAGDTQAAMRLVYDLQRCQYRDALSTSTLAVADRMRAQAAPESAAQAESMSGYLSRDLDHLDKLDALCAGITPGQIDARGEWLRLAAQEGDAQAMVCYAVAPFDFGPTPMSDAWFDWAEQWRKDAPIFVARAFAAGQADVVPLLRDAYDQGALLGDYRLTSYAYSQLVSPDPMLAYAYALLYERVAPQSGLESARRIAQTARTGLSDDQIAQAQRFADEAWPRFAAQAGLRSNLIPCRKYVSKAMRQ
jgi:hypothetical protein